ncbi:TonB-dependent receptor [Lysobacter sp. BMK333-48F3]|uniref:TonB-dependent receptor n=1 Tax=Lysobacter sp. BMK333-48F3 TaxID=2867962 RepID=UPI001C8C7550|nr:TonB-dependent receptor [Lysobacter sp. BMK333-48F3]MBX9403379.1 TonB-dependent receptor [Lysobacter sp. BMK333-48F3]
MPSSHPRSPTAPRRRALLLALLSGLAAQAVAQQSVAQQAAAQDGASAAAAADATTLDAVIVTAQKRAERIQDVPIALSVFSAQSLDELKIEGGAELLRATPNVNFSKSNFASYNFSIRGVGTKALSVTTDPGVAVSFNSTPLIRNRLFEQEYFDVDRIEVLRGPQGTLYGRNATGGVVNMIPNLPSLDGFEANLKGEVGNYDSRRVAGMLNLPAGDSLAFRLAGAWTRRDGYDYNTVTRRDVNDRDLWSARGSVLWTPNERVRASLVWEHFEEDDRRSRTGKQLCHRDPGPERVGASATDAPFYREYLSQACLPGSLYDDDAFGTPNGASLPQMLVAPGFVKLGWLPDFSDFVYALRGGVTAPIDPFGNARQSRDLREIATSYDPRFKAENDVVQLNFDFDLGNGLSLVSQSAYSKDDYYSTQDYGRFASVPIFSDSDGAVDDEGNPAFALTPGGVYTDPQLGPSTGYLAVDLSRARSKQWSQELRLQSDFDGRFNFNVGANYLDFEIDEDYYVFNNIFSLLAQGFYNQDALRGIAGYPPLDCPQNLDPSLPFYLQCVYIDPNPIDRIDGKGHNYFRSRNIARTRSWAVFGEGYWQLSDTVKLTAGLRYTDDTKITTPVPSQLLLAPGLRGGGLVNSGYPTLPDVRQSWGKFTGRLVLDWKPDLAYTDDTLVYASLARGYKAGGTNSPGIGADPEFLGFIPRDATFAPEYVNAFEIGTKNSFAGGKLQFNASAFYYDYRDYQVSQIVDRSAFNENFDATSYGLELELAWKPTDRLRLDANLGWLKTRIADGERSIDVMNRTQGDPDWVVVRPWLQQASNCVAPKDYVERILAVAGDYNIAPTILNNFCSPKFFLGGDLLPGGFYESLLGFSYDPRTDGPNGGQGFYADLGGNELPNAPRLTFNLGAQYTFLLGDSWDLTVRGDYYRQSKSYARVYNTVNDRLRSWSNANFSLTLNRPQSDLSVQLYVKNAFDKTPITDAFVNSDDSGLTTNVFTLDPRIVGLSVRKGFY